ncbi:MAG: ferrous iron transport protein B [Deltaproteobacteria bacterium]|nr:ferrous iron transport protein B [Deltaproteobacteria bacterium]
MKTKIVVGLAGNPNSGKTTIFNNLTGTRQHVGNYPGVTVERKEGFCRHGDVEIAVVDLPGTYSLTAYSAEEVVARNFIIDEKPDVVVDIIDASNLERNLYLAVQLVELGVPLVLAFNMSDMAKAHGHEFDIKMLSSFFGAPIVQTVGNKKKGMSELLDAVVRVAGAGEKNRVGNIDYGREIEEELGVIESLIAKDARLCRRYSPRWLAVKLLENDRDVWAGIDSPNLESAVEKSAFRIEKIIGEHPETAIAGRRYGFISGACQEAVRSTIEIRHTVSDRIDAVMTNRLLGIPIFLGLMYIVFQLTFTLGAPPMDWLGAGFSWLSGIVTGWWPNGSESLLKSLLVDGLIAGVGGVVIFLPNILLLFLAIAILEDSGYMARAAFIMDRLMHKIGLHGKSFIPMLVGFGCTVPAIMATRTLENRRDRLTTMLVLPLISCGARLPIYVLIIPAFFPQAWQGRMLWIIYMTGIFLAILLAKLLRISLLKGESVPFVMELPPYRMPTVKGIFIHMWERGRLFLKKAGTVILGVSVLLWAATTFPGLPENVKARFENEINKVQVSSMAKNIKAERIEQVANKKAEAALEYSMAGRMGHALEPVFAPMGFDWRLVTPVIGAIAAKEVFVAQLGIVFSVGEANEESGSLRSRLRDRYTPLTGFCILLFMLIVAPCMATFAVMKSESGSWGWATFQFTGLTVLAWILTTLVYQAGSFAGIGI